MSLVRSIVIGSCFAVAGSLFAIVNLNDKRTDFESSSEQRWSAPAHPTNYANSAPRFLDTLLSSGVFPTILAVDTQPQLVTIEETETEPPALIGILRRGSQFTAVLRDGSGMIAFGTERSMLDGGWTLESISESAVVLTRNDTTHRLSLFSN